MTIPITITDIIVAVVRNSRIVRRGKPGCRLVARAVAGVGADSKIVAKFAGLQPEKPINGAFQGVFWHGMGMSGKRNSGFCGCDIKRHTATKWLIRALFLPTTTTARANPYPCLSGDHRQKLSKNRRAK